MKFKIIDKKLFKVKIKNIIKFTSLIIGVPILTLISILNIFLPNKYKLRFSTFRSDRIAHFAMGFYIKYAKKRITKINPNTIYFINKSICSNHYLRKSISKEFNVKDWARIPVFICKKIPYLKHLYDDVGYDQVRDKEGFTQKVKMPKFETNEINFCMDWLKSYGWEGPSQPIVCLHIRDSAYLSKFFQNTVNEKIDWDYHNYRNSSLNSYIKGAEWLQKEPQSAFIVRTGKFAEEKLSLSNKNYIDYPFCNNQNDLIDIWLFANSDLVISTGSGPDYISASYGVPTLYLNFLPLGGTHSWSKCLHSSKHLYWSESKRHLTLEEYTLAQFLNTKDYKNMGIEIKDLSEDEILDIIKDGWNYFILKQNIKKSDIESTEIIKRILKTSSIHKKDNSFFNPQWYISSSFIKSDKLSK